MIGAALVVLVLALALAAGVCARHQHLVAQRDRRRLHILPHWPAKADLRPFDTDDDDEAPR